jgi:Predicted acetyltransferases and hydrolases with the alpha/beta hydrolase fold
MLCLFLTVLAFYLLVIFAVTLPYWYETGNSPSKDIPSSQWAFRPVTALLLEAAWRALQLGAAYPLDPILRQSENKDGDLEDLPPVLLVHGLYHSPSGWVYLRRHLRKAGFHKIHTLKYSSWKTDIATVTAKLDAAVLEVEARYPGRKPLLVGHSLGGLIIRNWLATEANQARALGAVTLGAPHQGSKIAMLAFGQLGRSLHPDNAFFAELANTEIPAGIPCVSLVSEGDTMVLPQQNLVPVTKGWEMRLTPFTSHAGSMTKKSICRMVIWELQRIAGMETRPAPEEPAEPAAPAEE